MNIYKDLVSKILKNEKLVNAMPVMLIGDTSGKKVINCVRPDFEDVIKHDVDLENFMTSGKSFWGGKKSQTENYELEFSKKSIEVFIVGHCKFSKSYGNSSNSIVILDSEPLTKIAQAMTSDLGTDISISNDFKFFFRNCHITSCNECLLSMKEFKKAGWMTHYETQQCILDTRIFDGNEVKNVFLRMMESIFSENFVALLHLKIDRRYSYSLHDQTFYRVGGTVQDIVAFYEHKLNTQTKKRNIGNLELYKNVIQIEPDSKKCKSDELASPAKRHTLIKEDDDMFSAELGFLEENKSSKENIKDETDECANASNNKILNQMNKNIEMTNLELFDLINGLRGS